MATEKQLIKLEKIDAICKKVDTKKVPEALAPNRVGYQVAIKSMMRVGEWATLTSILSVLALAITMIYRQFTHYNGLEDFEIFAGLLMGAAIIVSGVFGYKLWQLEVTPLFALISLLTILVVNAILCIGIFPIVVVILDIIALSRYATFCSWFNKLKTE